MAFLYQDQNQGIRNDARRGQAAVATVLFHPDFNRRLRNRTESAGPSCGEEGARGLGLRHLYRRWGVPPRPENIYPPGMSGLLELWPMAALPARACAWRIRMSPCRKSQTRSGKMGD